MVSTRRSASRLSSETGGSTLGGLDASQPEVASSPARQPEPHAAPMPSLQPIAEEEVPVVQLPQAEDPAPAAEPRPVRSARPRSARGAAQPQSQSQQPSQQPALQTHPSDSDSEGDWDFDSPDLLQSLAASIRAATSALGGGQAASTPWPAAAAGGPHDSDAALERLRWRPHTGLQLAPGAAEAVATAAATTAAAQRGKRQHPAPADEAGPVVDAPLHPAAPRQQQHQQQKQQQQLPGKPVGLSKSLTAPTLDEAAAARAARKAARSTAGKGWFNMPEVKITDEVKRDLRLLRLRGAFDPKRFYKAFDNTKFPKHFAIGTIQDDPLEHRSSRLSKGQRRATLTEQLLADPQLTASRKKRYSKLQEEANRWTKAKKRKTELPRKQPSKHRPKH